MHSNFMTRSRAIARRFPLQILRRAILALGLAVPLLAGQVSADERTHRLDFYFIDVEGGAATLIVTPAGESVLIDSGYPDHGGRDLERILHVLKEVAHRTQLDHAVVSHWHLDHYGNHAALASKIKVAHFWDRGMPDTLMEDPQYGERIALYRAASQNQSRALRVGDTLPLRSGDTPLKFSIVTGSGEVLPNNGTPNPFAKEHQPQPDDPSDNARSLSGLLSFGPFRFLTCGDLTWNTEAKLMTPNNPLGQLDLFMVTHHGMASSNNPVLVLPLDPTVAVICNGPTKGASPETLATLKRVKSLRDVWQLHRNVQFERADQAPASRIANDEETATCTGRWIEASVAADGTSFTVRVTGQPMQTYTTRGK